MPKLAILNNNRSVLASVSFPPAALQLLIPLFAANTEEEAARAFLEFKTEELRDWLRSQHADTAARNAKTAFDKKTWPHDANPGKA